MAKINVNKNVLRIVVTAIVAILTACALAGGIYYNINTVEQSKAYDKAIKMVTLYREDVNQYIPENPYFDTSKVFQIEDRATDNEQRAEAALELKNDYQKKTIMLYSGAGIMLAGNIFLNIKKKGKSKKEDKKPVEEDND